MQGCLVEHKSTQERVLTARLGSHPGEAGKDHLPEVTANPELISHLFPNSVPRQEVTGHHPNGVIVACQMDSISTTVSRAVVTLARR